MPESETEKLADRLERLAQFRELGTPPERLKRFIQDTGGLIVYAPAARPKPGAVGKPESVPAANLESATESGAEFVVQDFIRAGSVAMLAGSEGEGKTVLAWQIAAGLIAGGPVLGELEVPEKIGTVLIVDVEQSPEDAALARDLVRGLGVSTEGIYWLDAVGRSLDTPDDAKWLRAEIRARRPDVVIVDTATEAVTKPRDDESVKPLFVHANAWLNSEGVRAVLLLGQPRKRAQGAPNERQFDDLFGSRVWKGRPSAVFWLTESHLTVWKQRGGFLERRFGVKRREKITLERREGKPTVLRRPKSAAEADAERRAKILEIVSAEPSTWSKTSLVKDRLGIHPRDARQWMMIVDALVEAGELAQDTRNHNRLSVGPKSVGPL